MKRRLAPVWGASILAVAIPVVGATVCVAIIAVQLTLIALRSLIARLPARIGSARKYTEKPNFSVHVATHSEPPDMVIRTLRALLDQDWHPDFREIIVMDNNTLDPTLWKPVECFCKSHPDRITFLHRTGVSGAKAGALNIALEHSGPDTTHVVTVDADYVVHRDFLSRAAEALHRTGADYVQFPQSYVATTTAAPGIDAELEEYFRANAAVADEAEAVLLTGTLCVISKPALVAAGGWSGATTTEDAELGVRLCDAGFTGRFINQVVGQGLLPLSLKDLEKQRYRWSSGNFQTLLRHFRTIMTPAGSLLLPKRLVILSQLTAWFNPALVPGIMLLVWLMAGWDQTIAPTLAAAVIVLGLCDIVLRVIGRGVRDHLAPGVILHALACRIALAPQSAKATFDAFCGGSLTFIVTDKSGACRTNPRDLHSCHLLLFAAALIALITAPQSNPLILTALFCLMLPLPAAVITDLSLRNYRKALIAPKKVITP
ncbi:glycosyltransferase family 2 protein [Roseovarius sp. MMSF_3350]|uniref:glycosyltransferase family 2 protein n=1 Tax=Roseovarius sp. MMSF_3350 TaxID=3046706 RepID=UPI00273EA71A|nr:glycosyltransferase family 2 protein [Roseovarius sp. MMSF_3350]